MLLWQANSHTILKRVQSNIVEPEEEVKIQKIIKQGNKKSDKRYGQNFQNNLSSDKLFEIIFVHNNEEQSVEVEESPFIDFYRVIEQLREGNSVFIASKHLKRAHNKTVANRQIEFQ